MHFEARGLAANTINQQLAAVRQLAYDAADAGLLSPELVAGIGSVNGVKQLGFRSGNWLSLDHSPEILSHALGEGLRAKRDYAMLAMLFGVRPAQIGTGRSRHRRRSNLERAILGDCGFDRQGWPYSHRAIPAMGEAGFRPLDLSRRHHRRTGLPSSQQEGESRGTGICQNVVWYVVRSCCQRAGLDHIAPHDLRSYAESRIMPNRVRSIFIWR
jgi:hypothetical protein